MDCFSPEQVPVINKLAEEFLTYDSWFSSVPTSTNSNKVFLHVAENNGNMHNCYEWYCGGWPIFHTSI